MTHDTAKRVFKSKVRRALKDAIEYHWEQYWEQAEADETLPLPIGTHYWRRFNGNVDAATRDVFKWLALRLDPKP